MSYDHPGYGNSNGQNIEGTLNDNIHTKVQSGWIKYSCENSVKEVKEILIHVAGSPLEIK